MNIIIPDIDQIIVCLTELPALGNIKGLISTLVMNMHSDIVV